MARIKRKPWICNPNDGPPRAGDRSSSMLLRLYLAIRRRLWCLQS
ncbi:hypothetical protein CABS03_02789 [Colletotrichum abscissum]|uniref:Uncharacterized protein n=2 Tax=Colletotrichum acutatum species complex TaxID=2707335 RepID=A0A9P9XLH2_9PEZI|nr:hypothetical protein CABS02_04502 [Colletotrichum abscissum]KAK0376464.1 hypothetical protein CLIM01_06197 [Colletotrichum limetticola]